MVDVDKVVAVLFGLLGIVHFLIQLGWVARRRPKRQERPRMPRHAR